MIEYLYNGIKVARGTEATIEAKITDGKYPITEHCHLMLFDDVELIGTFGGSYHIETKTWVFTIPAEDTDKQGRFWYCICQEANRLCFKQPIYFE